MAERDPRSGETRRTETETETDIKRPAPRMVVGPERERQDEETGTMEQTREKARETMGQAEHEAKRVMHEAEDRAGEVAQQAEKEAKSFLDSTRSTAAERLEHIAGAMRNVEGNLNEQDEPTMAHYTDVLANRFEDFAGRLRSTDADELVGDVEDFARREPELFLGAAALTGLLLARIVKSSSTSSRSRYRQRTTARARSEWKPMRTGSTIPGRYAQGRESYGRAGTEQGNMWTEPQATEDETSRSDNTPSSDTPLA